MNVSSMLSYTHIIIKNVLKEILKICFTIKTVIMISIFFAKIGHSTVSFGMLIQICLYIYI